MEQRFCRNCGHPVGGEYCGHCGQREGRADRRFLDLAGEIVGDVVDVDSRFWRTLALLLFRPGRLTAEFIAGRRARYLPPLRLYLVLSFVVFLVVAMDASDALDGAVVAGDSDAAALPLDPNAVPAEPDSPESMITIGIADEDSPQWLQDLDDRLEANARQLEDDPGAFVEKIVSYLPQMMFLLLPLFALLVWLAYLLSPFHYLQHLVFALHYHSFVYLLYLVGQLLAYAGLALGGWLFLWLLMYLPLALRGAYGSAWRGALGKGLFICVAYGVLLAQGFAGVALIALALFR